MKSAAQKSFTVTSCSRRAAPGRKSRVSVFAPWQEEFDRPNLAAFRQLALAELAAQGHDGVKLSWRRNAGCACGCSPAFVADRELPGGDLFLDVQRERHLKLVR